MVVVANLHEDEEQRRGMKRNGWAHEQRGDTHGGHNEIAVG